jgi:DNA mismatch endonuclease, patch repair protein
MTRTDPFTPEQRSAIMRAVKSGDTAPERIVRAAARAAGFARRYRLGGAELAGKPDLVFPALRKAIFVHGCFWHGHTCTRGARVPKTNAAYWRAKIARNMARDRTSVSALRKAGWATLIVWECQTRDLALIARKLSTFLRR